MNKAHQIIDWKNYPDTSTAINASRLNQEDRAIDTIDDRVITLDITKASQTDLLNTVKQVNFVPSTGIMTVTLWNGTVQTFDTGVAKIAVNFDYDEITQRLILQLKDGTFKYIDLSALITQYEFDTTETIALNIVPLTGHVAANLVLGSVTPEHLSTDYLGQITVQAGIASAAATNALQSEENAYDYAIRSEEAESEIRKMTGIVQFSLDTDGNLIYNDEIPYSFEVNDDGNLLWEVVE